MENKAEWLNEVWTQRGMNALRETLAPDPDTKYAAIKFLQDTGQWDATGVTAEAAESRYNGNLNPGKKMNFRISEAWSLMRFLGRHQLLHAMVEDCGFQPLVRKPSEERKQEALEKIHLEMRRHNEVMSQLAGQLGVADLAQLRIHPAYQDGVGSFDVGEPGGF